MLPLKDNIPTDRLPILTLLLIAAGVAACFLVDGGTVQLLASAAFLWIFGTSVEDAMSRPRYALLCALGGAVAIALQRALDADAPTAVAGATGVTAAALGGYARLYLRAHVVTVLLVPFSFRLVEVPASALLGVWLALQLAFAVTSVGGPLADGGGALLLAVAAGCAVGLLTSGLLAQRRKRLSSPPAIPVWS